MNEGQNDFIDRKTGFLERMFDKLFAAIQNDPKSTFIVLLVFTNIFTFHLYTRSLENRLSDNQLYSEKIIQEVRDRVMPEIDREMTRRTQEIETKVDSASHTLSDIKEAVTNSLNENFK